jgi:hypothetical protein
MHPRALVADVGHLEQIGVETGLPDGNSRKSGSWVSGLHEATTTRFSPFSITVSVI